MDVKKLIRDPGRIHAALKKLPDGRVVALSDLKIHMPERFNGRNLAEVGVRTYGCGIFAYIVEDKYYAISLVNAMMELSPTSTSKVEIDGDLYYEFFFERGSTVIVSSALIQQDTLTFRIYDELMSKGRVPWYINYLDMAKIYDTAKYHAGANIGQEQEVTELIVSLISREQGNLKNYYRQSVKDMRDLVLRPPAFVPLKSVQHGATNTTNKLAGARFADGIVSALNNPAERTERVERILRT